MRQRFGIGYDSHVFVEKKPLILGGVKIQHTKGLMGHSDADAVAHAVIDALLGAAAMGDVGALFPDTDERWRDANSIKLLVITEAPKLAPYIDAMRENVAGALAIPLNAVSIKAKTNEKMDSVGRGRGLQVFAIASLGGA
jgi:2-C-methyl-D-erythritol 2,4-cyclodiphosphate synthase